MSIAFNVNGKPVSVDVPADMPLLWVLREQLDLVGTKFGCGRAQCGACTVHVNGAAVRSCTTPVSRAAGANVTTIEGRGLVKKCVNARQAAAFWVDDTAGTSMPSTYRTPR